MGHRHELDFSSMLIAFRLPEDALAIEKTLRRGTKKRRIKHMPDSDLLFIDPLTPQVRPFFRARVRVKLSTLGEVHLKPWFEVSRDDGLAIHRGDRNGPLAVFGKLANKIVYAEETLGSLSLLRFVDRELTVVDSPEPAFKKLLEQGWDESQAVKVKAELMNGYDARSH